MTQFYRHSGAVPAVGVIRTFVVGIAVATFLAIIYSYGIVWIPLVYVNFLLTLALGGITGYAVTREAKAAKIRQPFVPAAIGFLCGLAGLYVAWAADLVARGGVPAGTSYFIGLDPRVLSAYIEFFYQQGAWGIGRNGGNVSGLPLAAVWLIEACVIVGVATKIPWKAFRSLVFCEPCQQWTTDEANVARVQDLGADELTSRLQAGDFQALTAAPPAAADATGFVRLNLTSCDSCGETNCLDVERVTISVDKEGKQTEKTQSLLKGLLITAAEADLVRQAGATVTTTAEGEDADVDDEADEGDSGEPPAADTPPKAG